MGLNKQANERQHVLYMRRKLAVDEITGDFKSQAVTFDDLSILGNDTKGLKLGRRFRRDNLGRYWFEQ